MAEWVIRANTGREHSSASGGEKRKCQIIKIRYSKTEITETKAIQRTKEEKAAERNGRKRRNYDWRIGSYKTLTLSFASEHQKTYQWFFFQKRAVNLGRGLAVGNTETAEDSKTPLQRQQERLRKRIQWRQQRKQKQAWPVKSLVK